MGHYWLLWLGTTRRRAWSGAGHQLTRTKAGNDEAPSLHGSESPHCPGLGSVFVGIPTGARVFCAVVSRLPIRLLSLLPQLGPPRRLLLLLRTSSTHGTHRGPLKVLWSSGVISRVVCPFSGVPTEPSGVHSEQSRISRRAVSFAGVNEPANIPPKERPQPSESRLSLAYDSAVDKKSQLASSQNHQPEPHEDSLPSSRLFMQNTNQAAEAPPPPPVVSNSMSSRGSMSIEDIIRKCSSRLLLVPLGLVIGTAV